jgi:hypothetical protein
VALGIFQSVFDAEFLVKIVGFVNGNLRFFWETGNNGLDDFANGARLLDLGLLDMDSSGSAPGGVWYMKR